VDPLLYHSAAAAEALETVKTSDEETLPSLDDNSADRRQKICHIPQTLSLLHTCGSVAE